MPLDPPVCQPQGYATLDTLIGCINRQAKPQGYAVTKRRTRKKQGLVRWCDVFCDKGGWNPPLVATGQRQVTTRKSDCNFLVKATLQLAVGSWKFYVAIDHHNHEPP